MGGEYSRISIAMLGTDDHRQLVKRACIAKNSCTEVVARHNVPRQSKHFPGGCGSQLTCSTRRRVVALLQSLQSSRHRMMCSGTCGTWHWPGGSHTLLLMGAHRALPPS